MSVRLLSAVFQCNMPELKTDKGQTVPDSTSKFILLALADHANDEGEGSYPSVKRLCKKTNLSTATVCNALNALRTNGFIALQGKSRVETNNYTILVAKILEFQWLESDDSSGYNPSVLAAKTNPSVKPSVKPKGEGKPSRASSSDERLKHPAIVGYRAIARLHVPIAWRDDVINAVTDDPARVQAWCELVKVWIGRRYNPGNIVGMLEAFSNGGLKNGAGKTYPQDEQRLPKGV